MSGGAEHWKQKSLREVEDMREEIVALQEEKRAVNGEREEVRAQKLRLEGLVARAHQQPAGWL